VKSIGKCEEEHLHTEKLQNEHRKCSFRTFSRIECDVERCEEGAASQKIKNKHIRCSTWSIIRLISVHRNGERNERRK
jgi:hypothetical protein